MNNGSKALISGLMLRKKMDTKVSNACSSFLQSTVSNSGIPLDLY
jgi:hypothetical protein